MAFFDELTKKAKDVANLAADKAKDAAELTKITVAIAGEQKEIDKNYRTIGEWFVSEYEGEIPDAVRELVEAVNASKAKIAELEASKPAKEEEEEGQGAKGDLFSLPGVKWNSSKGNLAVLSKVLGALSCEPH